MIQRLRDYGIDDLFGIPGDYILSFYSELEKSPINVVGCTREDCAGFAADAYARINGMGAVCVTYCVGGLSVSNSIAGAYAEKSPVVVISGSPGLNERKGGALLHHMVRDFRTQIEVFGKFTIAGTELSDPLTALSEIDRVLDACDRFKRPVYIELPRDMVHVVPPVAHGYARPVFEDNVQATAEAVEETRELLAKAKKPVILAGVELHRFGLQDQLLQFAQTCKIPIATTMLGKSVVSERHPLFIGLYGGAIGNADVTEFVEDSDLVLMLGAFLSDINLGVYSAKLDPDRCVYATSEELRISHHHYRHVGLEEYVEGLNAANMKAVSREIPDSLVLKQTFDSGEQVNENDPLRTSRMMAMLNRRLDSEVIVVADVGDSLFAATELTIHDRGEFLSPAYYIHGIQYSCSVGCCDSKAKASCCGTCRRRCVSNDGSGIEHADLEWACTVNHCS